MPQGPLRETLRGRKIHNKNRHCEERSNHRFADPLCIVRDCFVPRNDGFLILMHQIKLRIKLRAPGYLQFYQGLIFVGFISHVMSA